MEYESQQEWNPVGMKPAVAGPRPTKRVLILGKALALVWALLPRSPLTTRPRLQPSQQQRAALAPTAKEHLCVVDLEQYFSKCLLNLAHKTISTFFF